MVMRAALVLALASAARGGALPSVWPVSTTYFSTDPAASAQFMASRLNASVVYVGRLRNVKDLEAIAEELAGERGKDSLRDAMLTATNDAPHSYLQINLMNPPDLAWRIRMDGPYL